MLEATIGLEIHVELKTKSKMFCQCKNDPTETTPNVNVCPVCLAHPGTLPVINKEAVKKVLKVAQTLNCVISSYSFFERKNYFYPDLPKGYQISQYQFPLGERGYFPLFSGEKIRIQRIHLEEDTGRLVHPQGKNYSLIDFNRAGIPLMELVTEPDIHSASQARDFVKELQILLRYLEVSDADMEKGQLRCEVNISLNEKGQLGTKVEIKNLNSLRAVERAIEYEITRQNEILKSGRKIVQETRGWHDKKQITFSQRQKEEAHDYRYFPEPDLPPLEITPEMLNEIRAEIPELPHQKRSRFIREYHLSEKEAEIFVFQNDLADFFEKTMTELREWIKEKRQEEKISENEFAKISKISANYVLTELQGYLNKTKKSIDSLSLTPENFAEFISMVYLGEISGPITKKLLNELLERGGDPSQILEEKNWKLITNEKEIEEIARKIVSENEKAVGDYKNGKETALQYLIGQLMKETQGAVRPDIAKEVLKKILS